MKTEKNAELTEKKSENKFLLDYISLGISTVGVGYIPLAPGTWGSAVGVLIYLVYRQLEVGILSNIAQQNFQIVITHAWIYVTTALLLLLLCFIGIWSATHATYLFKKKDPQQVVVDEVMGQLITFLFVPFTISWQLILCGFLLFRLFDIWKPYPIDLLQDLPGGLGVCIDDILAGVYAGICLSLLYAVGVSFL